MSFSRHAAQTKSSQVYYFILFAIVLSLFYSFILMWFVPALGLSDNFVYIVTAGVLGQLLAILVPAIPGRKEQVHNLGAYLMALTMLPAVILIAFADVSLLVSVAAIVTAVYMIATTVLFLAVKRSHFYFLYFQAAYIAAFHIVVILGAYAS